MHERVLFPAEVVSFLMIRYLEYYHGHHAAISFVCAFDLLERLRTARGGCGDPQNLRGKCDWSIPECRRSLLISPLRTRFSISLL